jgi:ATP-binding cassette subfamily E protein 1
MTDDIADRDRDYVAVIDQDEVTDEVRNIAVNYDPLNRSGHEGFHVTEDGELHIDDAVVMAEHRLIESKIPNEAVRIVPLPAATGRLVHRYGANGFRLHRLPLTESGSVIGLLGPNGIGKSTALAILAGEIVPNFGEPGQDDWEQVVTAYRGTALQSHFEAVRDGRLRTALKPQRVDVVEGTASATVRQRLDARRGRTADLLEPLGLEALLDRSVRDLSGGERQRLAVAETLATDAGLYLFDEPSSFLDVERRLDVARTIRDRVHDTDAAAVVVEHDLATLDLVGDGVHVVYGEPGAFGVVSERLGVREGINQFLEGYLRKENVRIRSDAISFPDPAERVVPAGPTVLSYPELSIDRGTFELAVDPGEVHEGEAVGVVGANGLGKTTLARTLAGEIDPDDGEIEGSVRIAYKPQEPSPDGQGTVGDRLRSVADVQDPGFRADVEAPLELEPLWDRPVEDLSGGELQRVAIGLCLAREADLHLLDEPSAFLDVDRRVSVADHLHRFARRRDRPVIVVDHDLFTIGRFADRLIVFDGQPGRRGRAHAPEPLRDGMNRFLATLGVTFRRDERTGRPRVNDPGSQLDREQQRSGEYYYE